MPVLLYGCENWILRGSHIDKLHCFLGELAKYALGWPKHHSNTAAHVALDLESIRCRLLSAKLGFLRRSMVGREGIGAEMMCVMVDDVESLCLVKECRELEETYGTCFTDGILEDAEQSSMREVRDTLRAMDREKMLERCKGKSGLVVEVARAKTWTKLWDDVMDLGPWKVKGLRNLSRVLSSHGRGNKPCPRCDVGDLGGVLLDHLVERHWEELRMERNWQTSTIVNNLKEGNLNFLGKFSCIYK